MERIEIDLDPRTTCGRNGSLLSTHHVFVHTPYCLYTPGLSFLPCFLLPFPRLMDHLAHHLPFNHRKRKADPEEQKDNTTNDPIVISPPLAASSVATSASSNAPRHPWLASGNDTSVWSSSSSPPVSSPLSSEVSFTYPPKSTKRPRLERIETTLRHPRRLSPTSRKSAVFTCRPSPLRPGNDIEDIGVVSTADPGPSTGSLLDLRTVPKLPEPGLSPVPIIPIDTTSPHIPSLQPLINRQTLKELDLDTILRNPQLRAFHTH